MLKRLRWTENLTDFKKNTAHGADSDKDKLTGAGPLSVLTGGFSPVLR